MTQTGFESWLISTLKADLLSAGGKPLITLLNNLSAHAGNLPLEAADLLAFQATAPGAGLALGIEFQQQLIALVIAKLQASIAPA